MKELEKPVFPKSDTHFSHKDGYQRRIVKHSVSHCRQKRLVIDIGAHVGLITRQFLEFGFDRVICFEPVSENTACLRRNTDSRRVTIYRMALSSKPGKFFLANPTPTNSGAWEGVKADATGLIETCHAERLDWFGFHPDLIKIDVQGHELQVLHGAMNTLVEHKPVVIVECWRNGERDNRPRQYLESLGATCVESLGKDLIFAWKESKNDFQPISSAGSAGVQAIGIGM